MSSAPSARALLALVSSSTRLSASVCRRSRSSSNCSCSFWYAVRFYGGDTTVSALDSYSYDVALNKRTAHRLELATQFRHFALCTLDLLHCSCLPRR